MSAGSSKTKVEQTTECPIKAKLVDEIIRRQEAQECAELELSQYEISKGNTDPAWKKKPRPKDTP